MTAPLRQLLYDSPFTAALLQQLLYGSPSPAVPLWQLVFGSSSTAVPLQKLLCISPSAGSRWLQTADSVAELLLVNVKLGHTGSHCWPVATNFTTWVALFTCSPHSRLTCLHLISYQLQFTKPGSLLASDLFTAAPAVVKQSFGNGKSLKPLQLAYSSA
jgi:hypothetical protein